MLPEYCGHLYLVFGFPGILLVDADSHSDAFDEYCAFHDCDGTMVEHFMRAPDPDLWGVPWKSRGVPEHLCVDAGTDNMDCTICDPPLPYMASIPLDPQDPRLKAIDLEADKATLLAGADQLAARWAAEETGEEK